jgi:outer membrane protein
MSAAGKTKTARWLSLLPEVDAEGGYLRIDGQLFAPPNQWYVGVRANWAIWEWGASFYQARAAGRLAQAAVFDADNQRRAVATEVQTGLSTTRAAGAAVEVAQTAIASAEEAYRVTNALLQAGSATTTDLLDAQSALTTARLNLTRAQYERAIQRVSLGRVLAE